MMLYVKFYKARRLTIFVCLLMLLLASQSVAGTWTTKAPMPTARANPAGTAVNDSVYIIGGTNSGTYYPVNEVYDPLSDTWTTKAPMPINQRFCRAVTLNGKIYVVGIENWSGPASLQEYNPTTDTWIVRTPMNVVRHSFAVGTANGKIYVIGGETSPGNVYVADNEEYDPNTDTWTAKTPMPTARARLTIGVWNDTLFCVGGNDTDSTYSRNEAYDPLSDTWTIEANMITKRYGLAAAKIEDSIYYLGGAFVMDRDLNEAYVPTTNSWFTDTPIPTGRGYFAAVSAIGKIYAIGGLQNFDYLDVNEEFTAAIGVKESQTLKSTCSALKISPNPFKQMTEIRCQIKGTEQSAKSTELKIYDITGHVVKVFSLPTAYSLLYTVISWDGTDSSNRKLPCGIYFVQLETETLKYTEKVVLMR